MVFRAAAERADMEIVAVNDLLELPHLAYLLRHDSVHGPFRRHVEVKDNLLAFRVPVSDVSVVDLTCELTRAAKYEDICGAMQRASNGSMKGVLGYTEEEVVSTDIRGETCTSVFDAKASVQLDSTFVKVVAWYDNEWGYASKLLDLAVKVLN